MGHRGRIGQRAARKAWAQAAWLSQREGRSEEPPGHCHRIALGVPSCAVT